MRRFTVYRRHINTALHLEGIHKNAPDKPQFEGVQFSDSTVAVRWLTNNGSTAIWSSMEDLIKIHGHPEYGTEIIWHDEKHNE